MDIRPRAKLPRQIKVGDTIEVKTRVIHKMETGLRKDQKSGKLVPRDIISNFVAKFNGEEVFRTTLHPATSANPLITFFMTVPGEGEFEFIWTE